MSLDGLAARRRSRLPVLATLAVLLFLVLPGSGRCDTPAGLQDTCWEDDSASERICIRPHSIEVRLGKQAALLLRETSKRSFAFENAPVDRIRKFSAEVFALYPDELDRALGSGGAYPSLFIRDKDRAIALVRVRPDALLKLEQSRADPPLLSRFALAGRVARSPKDFDVNAPPR